MNKKIIIYIVIAILVLALIITVVFINIQNSDVKELEKNQNYNSTEKTENTIEQEQVEDIETLIKRQGKEEKIDMIKIKVNNNVLEVKLEDNESTKSLVERLKNGDISVKANEYGV